MTMIFRFLIVFAVLCQLLPVQAADDDAAYQQAQKSAAIAGYSLSKVHRWVHEKAIPRIDEKTGLYIADGHWNYRDTAADCYPFFTWAAWVVDKPVLNSHIRRILHAEKRLCNALDRIPTPYDYKNGKQIEVEFDELIFQASEYVKDGLIAIVEITGRDEWFERMREIEDDIWKHARYDTPYGKIPSKNVEVNGEQIQALVRLFTMTGESRYLRYAERLADFYLADPDWYPNRLRDHGCEIIGGLGLLLGVESEHNPKKAKAYAKRLKSMYDAILAQGCNEDGMMYNEIRRESFGDAYRDYSDGWGYNYVSYLCYDYATRTKTYQPGIARLLQNLLKPEYRDYRWESSIDGHADSIEGALYLLNRISVPEGLQWVDREMAKSVIYASEPLETAELWGTMKLQANGVRTVLMHALMHTQGVIARPWRGDLQLGAAPTRDGLVLSMSAKEPWEGVLEFDIPRHRHYMGFAKDWPRMNTMPEWFTVELDEKYRVSTTGRDDAVYTGAQLHTGYAVSIEAGQDVRVTLKK
jgi:hypothetical protein